MAMNDVRAIKETQKFTSNLVAGGISQETAEEIALKLDGLDGAKDGKIHITADYPQQAMMACDWLKDKALPSRMASWKWENVRDLVTIDLQYSIKPENRPLGDKLDAWFKAEDGFLESFMILCGANSSPANSSDSETIETPVLAAPPLLAAAVVPPLDEGAKQSLTQIFILLNAINEKMSSPPFEFELKQTVGVLINELKGPIASLKVNKLDGAQGPAWIESFKRQLIEIEGYLNSGNVQSIRVRLGVLFSTENLRQLRSTVSAISTTAPSAPQGAVRALPGTFLDLVVKSGVTPANLESALKQAVSAPSVGPAGIESGAREMVGTAHAVTVRPGDIPPMPSAQAIAQGAKALPTPSEARTMNPAEVNPRLRGVLGWDKPSQRAATQKTKVISDGPVPRFLHALKNKLPSARNAQKSLEAGSRQVNLSAQRTGVRPLVLVAGGIALAAAAIGAGIWIYTKMEDGK